VFGVDFVVLAGAEVDGGFFLVFGGALGFELIGGFGVVIAPVGAGIGGILALDGDGGVGLTGGFNAEDRVGVVNGDQLAFEGTVDEDGEAGTADFVVGFDEGLLLGHALGDEGFVVEAGLLVLPVIFDGLDG